MSNLLAMKIDRDHLCCYWSNVTCELMLFANEVVALSADYYSYLGSNQLAASTPIAACRLKAL